MSARNLEPIPQAQEVLGGISRTTLWGLVKSGHVDQVNIGRRVFITRESMDRYVASLASGDAV